MAFALDATISGTSANSYSTVANADDYFSGRLKNTAWTEASTSTKEAALVQASTRIDRELFSGSKVVTGQALSWPRSSIYDHYALIIETDIISKGIVHASLELALWYLDEDNRLLSDQDLNDFDSYNLGPISVSVNRQNSKSDLPAFVQALIHSIGPGVWVSGTKITRFTR